MDVLVRCTYTLNLTLPISNYLCRLATLTCVETNFLTPWPRRGYQVPVKKGSRCGNEWQEGLTGRKRVEREEEKTLGPKMQEPLASAEPPFLIPF